MKTKSTSGKSPRQRLYVLTKRSDFLKTFKSGLKVRPCDWMIFNYAISTSFRCGWTCPKAVGVAPIRNRLKRWTREWIRERLQKSDLPPIDLNVGFRAQPPGFFKLLKRSEFDQAMERGWVQLVKRTIKTVPKSSL